MQFFKNIINLFTLLVLFIALNINMTSKITERSALKLEEDRSYEEQLKNQIKWLSQLKWNWTNNRDENNDKFFYDFFDFCFQNFEMSITAQLRSINYRMHFHKELSSVKNNISKIKVDIKKILASDLPTKKDFTILKAKFQKVKIGLTEVEMKFDSIMNEIHHKKGEDNDMEEAMTPPMLHYGTNGGNGGDEDGDENQWHEERHHQDNHENEKKEDSSKDSTMVMATGQDCSRSSDFKVDKQMTGKNERRESEVNSLLMIQNNNNDTNDASNYNENNEKIIENIDKKSEYGVNNNKINKYNYGYKNKNSSDNSTNNNINNISNTYNSSINNNNSNHEDNNKDKDTEKGNQTINNIINENNNSLQIINYNNNNNNFNC